MCCTVCTFLALTDALLHYAALYDTAVIVFVKSTNTTGTTGMIQLYFYCYQGVVMYLVSNCHAVCCVGCEAPRKGVSGRGRPPLPLRLACRTVFYAS